MLEAKTSPKLRRKYSFCFKSPYRKLSVFKKAPSSSSSMSSNRKSLNIIKTTDSYLSSKTSTFIRTLKQHDIPESLIEVYINLVSLLSQSNALRFIQDEISFLTHNKSFLQIALSSYKIWKSSLENLQKLSEASKVDKKWKTNLVFLNEVQSGLTDHSYFTLVLVENIKVWEGSLSKYLRSEQSVSFVIDGVIVFDEIMESCDFLIDSDLNFYFSFSPSDPFLLSISNKQDKYLLKSQRVNLVSSRDTKMILYIYIEKEALFKMRRLTKELFRKVILYNSFKPKISIFSSTSLPHLKQEYKTVKSFNFLHIQDALINNLIHEILKADINEITNQILAEKLVLSLISEETKNQVNEIAQLSLNFEKIHKKKTAKEVFYLTHAIYNETFDDFLTSVVKLEKICRGLYNQEQNDFRKKIELRVSRENNKIADDLKNIIWKNEVELIVYSTAQLCFEEAQKEFSVMMKTKEDNERLCAYFLAGIIDEVVGSLVDFEDLSSGIYEDTARELEKELQQRIAGENLIISNELTEDLLTLNNIQDALSALAEICTLEFQQEQETQQKLSEEISENIISFETIQVLEGICNDVYITEKSNYEEQVRLEESSRNARNLQLSMIYDSLLRNLIELVLEEMPKLCDEVFQEAVAKMENAKQLEILLKFENEKLKSDVFNGLVECFLDLKWVSELCENMIALENEVLVKRDSMADDDIRKSAIFSDDYAMEVFTPGIHSPNEITIGHIDQKSIINETQSLEIESPRYLLNEFNRELSTITSPKLIPILEKPKNLLGTIRKYTELIHESYEDFLLINEKLIEDFSLYWNTYLYWISSGSRVIGLFVYSHISTGYIINHISVINISLIEEILEYIPSFLNSPDSVIQLKFKKIFPQIEAKLISLDYSLVEVNDAFIIFQNSLPDVTQQHTLSIFSELTLSASTEKLPKKNTKIQNSSSRFHLISLITSVLPQNSPELCEGVNRLQEDLNELIEIVLYSFLPSFKYISTSLDPSNQAEELTHSGVISLNINIYSVIYSRLETESSSYKSFQVSKNQVQIRHGEDGCKMYIIHTADPDISVFIYESSDLQAELQDAIRINKVDLFNHACELCKSLDDPVECEKDLIIPCFLKENNTEIGWVKDYVFHLDDQEKVVTNCGEKFKAKFSYSGDENLSLNLNRKCFKVEGEFLFGVLDSKIYELLEIPLFALLVNKEDWVEYNNSDR